MIYTTFKQWVKGRFLETGEPRKKAYSKDELALIEMGWGYGYDAGVQWQKSQTALDKKAENARELGLDYEPENTLHWHALNYRTASTQNEVIDMAEQAGFTHPNPHDGYMGLAYDRRTGTDTGASLETFAKLVDKKAFEQGFYAGFEASGEGWNGECPFHDKGFDIQQDESVQHELKEAIRTRGQA